MKKRNRLHLMVLLVIALALTTLVWWGCSFKEVGPVDMVEYDFSERFEDIVFPEIQIDTVEFPEITPGSIDTSGSLLYNEFLEEAAETDVIPDTLQQIADGVELLLSESELDSLCNCDPEGLIGYIDEHGEAPGWLGNIILKLQDDSFLEFIMPTYEMPYINETVALYPEEADRVHFFDPPLGSDAPPIYDPWNSDGFAECIQSFESAYNTAVSAIESAFWAAIDIIEGTYNFVVGLAQTLMDGIRIAAISAYNLAVSIANGILSTALAAIGLIRILNPTLAAVLEAAAYAVYYAAILAAAVIRDGIILLAEIAYSETVSAADLARSSATTLAELARLSMLDAAYDAYLAGCNWCHDQGTTAGLNMRQIH